MHSVIIWLQNWFPRLHTDFCNKLKFAIENSDLHCNNTSLILDQIHANTTFLKYFSYM